VEARGGRLLQANLVIVLDRPKLAPHRQALTQNLSRLLGLPQDRVGLTFKTSEGLAPRHVQARAVVLLDG
jgi:2-C-methyl-D-erythritol 2,4-cyclodiphosphate synthase